MNQSVQVWKDHLEELEKIPNGVSDMNVREGISYAREVFRKKEAGELPYLSC